MVDIVHYGPLRIVIRFIVFKTWLLGRGFHTLVRNASFPSPTDLGSHNLPPLGAQCFRWHTARYLTLISFVTAPKSTATRYCPLWAITYRY